MSVSFHILAQVNAGPESADVTFGNVLAGLLVMATLACSLVMVVLWGIRLSQGREIIPAARRKPLFVPLPLLILGVALTAMMAMLMLQNTLLSPPNDVVDTADISAEIGDEAGQPLSAEDAATSGEADAGDAGDAGRPDMEKGPSESGGAAADATASTDPETQALLTMYQQLMFFAVIFMVFGATIWLTQLNRGRSAVDPVDETFATSVAVDRFVHGESRFPDLDEPPEITATRTALLNPYAASDLISEQPQEESTVPERWHPPTELRFAFETFLAAYLPTAVLRIIIVLLLPEVPSHPFLEMLDDGVGWTLLLLIGLMAVVVAPIVEELLYRVTILGGLIEQRSLMAGWIVSSVLFAFAHGFPDSIALLPLAFAIGYTYIKRRSYRTVVLVHFLFNAFNMAVAGLSLL